MKKKWISLLLTTAVCVGMLAGCSNEKPSVTEAETPSKNDAAAYEEQELSIAIFEGGYGPDYWNEIITMFEESHPGVTVKMQISPKIGDIIRPQIVAGNVPDFISMNDNDLTGVIISLIKEDGLTKLTDVFKNPGLEDTSPLEDQIIDGILNTAKCSPYGDGEIYLAPFNAGPMGLVYNKTLFEENNWELPVTWDDFFALGDKAKEKGIALFTYPGLYPGYMESLLWPSIASAAGLDTLNSISSYTEGSFDSPEVLKVLENIKKISDGGYLMDGTTSLNHTQSQTDMMMNKALFIPNGNWMEGEMQDAPRADGFEFGLCPAPVLKEGDTHYVMTSIEQFSIPKNAKNPELAKEFLRFLYTEKSVKLFAEKANGIYALKNADEWSKGIVTNGVYNMNGIYDNATSMVFGWDAMPKGCKVDIAAPVFRVISDVINGTISPEQWAQGVEDAFAEVNTLK